MKQLVGFILVLSFSLKSAARHFYSDLQRAIDLRLVEARITSLGIYKGNCISLRLKNLGKDTLHVLVEAGRRLDSKDDQNQDILVVKDQLIVLSTQEEKAVTIKGYCCQASRHCPSPGALYDAGKMADSNLIKIARFINQNCFGETIEQCAVWVISDKQPIAGVGDKNDSAGTVLRRMLAGMRGETLPWYSIISNTYVYPGGSIVTVPLKLYGQFKYSNDKDNYVTLTVLNGKGEPVCQVKSQWLKAGVNQDYNLDLPVKGLAKGKYQVQLKTPEKQLAKQEFEI